MTTPSDVRPARRVLVRTYRDPFARLTAQEAYDQDAVGGGNVGNLVFSDAAYRILLADGVEVVGARLDGEKPSPEQVSEEYDHVVLPFANAFSNNFRKQLRDYTAWLTRLRIPVTILGIGAQGSIDYDTASVANLDEDVSAFMAAALERGPSVGVRGEFSAAYLRELGFSEVEVIGCPSMFTRGPELHVRPFPAGFGEATRVAVNMTPRVKVPGAFFDRLLDAHPGLVYFPQRRDELAVALRGPERGPRSNQLRVDHPLRARAAARVHVDPASWQHDLGHFDLSLGTRIHGNISAALGGTPSVVITHDSRTRELAEYFELPTRRADTIRETTTLAEIVAGADEGATSRGHARRLETFSSYLDAHGVEHTAREAVAPRWEAARGGAPDPAPATWGPVTPTP